MQGSSQMQVSFQLRNTENNFHHGKKYFAILPNLGKLQAREENTNLCKDIANWFPVFTTTVLLPYALTEEHNLLWEAPQHLCGRRTQSHSLSVISFSKHYSIQTAFSSNSHFNTKSIHNLIYNPTLWYKLTLRTLCKISCKPAVNEFHKQSLCKAMNIKHCTTLCTCTNPA